MQQIFSIRSGALIITSVRIASTLLFLLCLCFGTIKIVRLEKQIEEHQQNIKDGNGEIVNNEKGDHYCGTAVLPCTQVHYPKITC